MKLQGSVLLILFICFSCNHVDKNDNINANAADSAVQTAETNDPATTDASTYVPDQNTPNVRMYSLYGYRRNTLNAIVFNENATVYVKRQLNIIPGMVVF